MLNGPQQRNLFGIVRRLRDLARPPDLAPKQRRCAAAAGDAQPLAARIRSVFEKPWQEIDERASLYFDPSLREHACRWSDPTSDPARFDRIANLLALVGLSLLPVIPVDEAGTVTPASACCGGAGNGRTTMFWPIWRGAVGFGTASRLLLMPGLADVVLPGDVAARGTVVVMRAEIYAVEGAKGAKTYTSSAPIRWA